MRVVRPLTGVLEVVHIVAQSRKPKWILEVIPADATKRVLRYEARYDYPKAFGHRLCRRNWSRNMGTPRSVRSYCGTSTRLATAAGLSTDSIYFPDLVCSCPCKGNQLSTSVDDRIWSLDSSGETPEPSPSKSGYCGLARLSVTRKRCPLANTSSKSQCRKVLCRCAMIKVVRSAIRRSVASMIAFSVSVSTELVGSSRMSNGLSLMNARAKETRCLSPPESLPPRSPTKVS